MPPLTWCSRWEPLRQRALAPALVHDTSRCLAEVLDHRRTCPPPDGRLPAAACGALAKDLIHLAAIATDAHELNLIALAVIALAHASDLMSKPAEPIPDAHDVLERLLPHAPRLPRATARLLDQVRDGVALDDGRAVFIEAVRRALRRAQRHRPGLVDVDPKSHPTLAGRVLAYVHDEIAEDGSRVEVRRPFTMSNREGRLFLLIAAGMPMMSPSRSVLSRVRRTVEDETRDRVRLLSIDGKLQFVPPLELTPRARMLARRLPSMPPTSKRCVRLA